MKAVRILGIDPGFDRVGISILDKEGSTEHLVFSCSITTSKQDSFSSRLLVVGKELEDVIQKYKPHHVAIETLFVTKNQKTAMLVSQARGVIMYICQKSNLELFEYSPPQIKLAVTGFGKSEKQDVAFMVSKILKLSPSENRLDDELDAIAVALTHSAHYKAFLGTTL
jgi:crossover junction endodeoxyribonuclease RuvC